MYNVYYIIYFDVLINPKFKYCFLRINIVSLIDFDTPLKCFWRFNGCIKFMFKFYIFYFTLSVLILAFSKFLSSLSAGNMKNQSHQSFHFTFQVNSPKALTTTYTNSSSFWLPAPLCYSDLHINLTTLYFNIVHNHLWRNYWACSVLNLF